MLARCQWTEEQAKVLQKHLKVWPSGNLEHQTWAALTQALGMVEEKPEPDANPFYVMGHWLYEYTARVNFKATPNISAGTISPEIVVIHYTGDNSLAGALSWLTKKGSGVSAHLVIAKTGQVWQLAPFNRRTWHAGQSIYDGRADCNSFAIGIELVGLGDDFPEAQISTLANILEALYKAYPDIYATVGHDEVAVPAGRKSDPGKNFDWELIPQPGDE